jgi:hypothetical protein
MTSAYRTAYRRPRRPPSVLPWACVVLGVDTARRSGWAIRSRGALLYSGELDTTYAPRVREVIELAGVIANAARLPLVLVLERAYGGKAFVLVALGQARERWLGPWVELGYRRTQVVSVLPATWRARVLGRAHAIARRDEVRAVEMQAARRMVAAAMRDELGADEAAAILISQWATYAGEVGAVLGRKR